MYVDITKTFVKLNMLAYVDGIKLSDVLAVMFGDQCVYFVYPYAIECGIHFDDVLWHIS
tara:strand:+ start:3478 stop:3654 length:177 start_codon:yes stop_codon:yes gene_type:complete